MTAPVVLLEEQDRALLDRVAVRIVELRLEVPAILTLESSRPLTVVAGQTLLYLEPIISALFHLPDYRRFAQVIEHRESLDYLIRAIEARVDARPPRGKKSPRPAARGDESADDMGRP